MTRAADMPMTGATTSQLPTAQCAGPTFFGRRWHGGLPSGLLEPELFFTDCAEHRFPMHVESRRERDDLVLSADIPGIDPEHDIEIGVDGRRLSIQAIRAERIEATEERAERRAGLFHRVMTLPDDADVDAVSATYADGMLEIRVPLRSERSPATRIPITRR